MKNKNVHPLFRDLINAIDPDKIIRLANQINDQLDLIEPRCPICGKGEKTSKKIIVCKDCQKMLN